AEMVAGEGNGVASDPDGTAGAGAAGLFDLRYVWYRLSRSPLAMVGLAIIVAVLLVMALAPVIAPYDPNALDLRSRLSPPSAEHWLGTDQVGRDLLSRIIWGSRVSVTVGIAIVFFSMSIGTLLGAFSGLVGGRVDTAIMRLMDVLLSFPSFVMAMALAAA